MDVKHWLILPGLQNFLKAESPWQDGFMERLEAFDGSFKLLVSNEIILIFFLGCSIVIIVILFILPILTVGFFVIHFDLKVFLMTKVVDHAHDKMEVMLCLVVCYKVVQSGTVHIDSGTLDSKYSLHSLEHEKNVLRGHALIIIVITELKE